MTCHTGPYYGTYNRLNVHVTASDAEVIRALWRKFTTYGKARDQRKPRHEVIRHILAHHKDALRLWLGMRL